MLQPEGKGGKVCVCVCVCEGGGIVCVLGRDSWRESG